LALGKVVQLRLRLRSFFFHLGEGSGFGFPLQFKKRLAGADGIPAGDGELCEGSPERRCHVHIFALEIALDLAAGLRGAASEQRSRENGKQDVR
jgi:hypothetical protein